MFRVLSSLIAAILCVCTTHAQGDNNVDPFFDVGSMYPRENDVLNQIILLVSWDPHPIDLWDYVVVNTSGQAVVLEKGRLEITKFTKDSFPDVTLVFTCTKGDFSYFPDDLLVPVIGVDSFQNDHYFIQFLNIIYTIFDFQNESELWSHFFLYQDAFEPVRRRVSSTFQEYFDNYQARQQPAE